MDKELAPSCLPVGNVAFNHSIYKTGDISDMTAEQYMSWVRHQSDRMPIVFRAVVDTAVYEGKQTKYMPQVDGIMSCPEVYQPDSDWVSNVLYEFSELRSVLGRLGLQDKERRVAVPAMKDRATWHLFCLGVEERIGEGLGDEEGGEEGEEGDDDEVDEEEDEEDEEEDEQEHGGQPGEANQATHNGEQSAVVQQEEEGAEPQGFEQLVQLLEDKKKQLSLQMGLGPDAPGHDALAPAPAPSPAPAKESWAGQVNSQPTTTLLMQFDHVLIQKLLAMHTDWLAGRDMSVARGQWLYGLLARLEKPLYQDAAAVVRQLYRRCCELRAGLLGDSATFAQDLATLNVLISLAGTYFGQGEECSGGPSIHALGIALNGGGERGVGRALGNGDDMEEGEMEDGEEVEVDEAEEEGEIAEDK